MKKIIMASFFVAVLFLFTGSADAIETQSKKFSGSGEVTSVDPLYSRIHIHHSAIEGFSGEGETDFVVASNDLIKSITTRDLVDFEIEDLKGDTKITKITRTGQALPKESGLPIGRVAQDLLEGTGGIAKTLTEPITPVGQVVGGTVDATTGATDAVIGDKNSEVSHKF